MAVAKCSTGRVGEDGVPVALLARSFDVGLDAVDRLTGLPVVAELGAADDPVEIHRIYLHSLRLGGSGFGNVLSVAAPNPQVGTAPADQSSDYDERSYFELDRRLELYKAELASVQLYAESGSESLLCISGSGKKIFYRGAQKDSEETALYLIENDQPPRKVAPDLK